VWRDDGRGTIVKGNDSDGWSSDVMVLWLESRTVRGGWPAVMVQIQCFDFDSRGCDKIKHCQKIKRRQRAHLGSGKET
jgi:hypothetical protein